MQVRLSVAAVIVMACCMVPGARAESPTPDDVVKPIFGDTRGGKSYACFVRHYGAAHLARHRKQTVTEIRLLLTVEKVAEDEQLNYSFAFNASIRNKGRWEAYGSCGHAKLSETRGGAVDIGCAGDCEGGLISVELVGASKPAVVRLDNLRVLRIGAPEKSRQLGGGDDGVFHLRRVSLSECGSLMPKDDELASAETR
jgi:hypothetical protein